MVGRTLLNVIPERFHPLLLGAYQTVYPHKHITHSVRPPMHDEETKYPHTIESVPDSLPSSNYSEITLVPNRETLLEKFPTGGKVAEIGVSRGDYAEKIHSILKPDELYLIDTWSGEYRSHKTIVEKKFEKEIRDGNVHLVRKKSTEALTMFEDDFFDFAYLDTTHMYKQTLEELRLLDEKVAKDGVIAGDDFSIGNLPSRQQYGVIPAVFQFCTENNWKIEYLTLQPAGNDSFALVKSD